MLARTVRAGAAENDRYLAVVKPFPRAQREQFSLRVGQPAEGRRQLRQFTGELRWTVGDGEVGPQPFGQCRTAPLAAMVVGQHPPGHAIEPRPGMLWAPVRP